MEDGIKISKICLTITCTWPCKKRPILLQIFGICWLLTAILYTLSIYVETVISIRNKDLMKISSIIHWLLLMTAYLAKYANFIYSRKYVVELEELLNENLFSNHPEALNHHLTSAIKYARIIGKGYLSVCFGYLVIYLTIPLIVENRNLPSPISIDLGNYLPIIYLIQAVGFLHAGIANAALDILFVSMVLLGCSQFDILNRKILNLCKAEEEIRNDSTTTFNETDRKLAQNLTNIVKHHHLIIKFFEYQEKIFTFGLLMQFLGSIAALSCLTFLILLVPPNTTEFYTILLMFSIVICQILFYCYFGDMVMSKSAQIAKACYFCDWYKCNPVIIKSLILIMQRSAKPLGITIMKFAPLSLELFKSILRTSYSYFALLLRFSGNKQ